MTDTTTTDTESPTFRIPAERMEYLTARIAKLVKRQARLAKRGPIADSTPIAVEIVRTEVDRKCRACDRPRNAPCNTGCKGLRIVLYTYHVVTVTGAAPHLAGFEFLATLQHETAGTMIRTVPTAKVADGELDRFRAVRPHCEHCEVKRNRKSSFVVRETSTGITRQVGTSCLGAYLGGQSPTGVAGLAELLIEAAAACDEESGWDGGSGAACNPALTSFLIATAASVRLYGWTSRGMAHDRDDLQSTADHVGAMLAFSKSDALIARQRAFFREITAEDTATAAAALQLAGDRWVNAGRLTDYEHNMRIALSMTSVSHKCAGFVASLISWHERETGKVTERAATAASEHIGSIKLRLDLTLVVTRIVDSESDYGTTHGHFMRDPDGNVCVWWTGATRLEVGQTYTVRGTVKKHDTYSGTKQTVLTRCAAQRAERAKLAQ